MFFWIRVFTRSTSSLLGGSLAKSSTVLIRICAGFVQVLIGAQLRGGDHESGVVQLVRAHAGGDGLLVVHQGLVEAAGRHVAQHAASTWMAASSGCERGRHMVHRHDVLGVTHAPQRDRAFAILRRLHGVRLFELALRAGDLAEQLGNPGQRLGGIELAGHGEHGVVGLVILLVERRQLLDGHVFDVGRDCRWSDVP